MESWLLSVFSPLRRVVVQADGSHFAAVFEPSLVTTTRSPLLRLLPCRNDPTVHVLPRERLCDAFLDADLLSASPLQRVALAQSALSPAVVVHLVALEPVAQDMPAWSAALEHCARNAFLLVPADFARDHASALAFVGLFAGDAFDSWCLLQRQPYMVREASVFDLDALARLELSWDATALQASESELMRRLFEFPEDQLVLEMHGTLVAVVYTQRIKDLLVLAPGCSGADMPSLACQGGPVVQFLAALSDPRFANAQPAHHLLQFALHLFHCRGFRQVLAVTRWSQFAQRRLSNAELRPQDYFAFRETDGLSVDATVRWHQGGPFAAVVPLLFVDTLLQLAEQKWLR